MTPRQSRDRLPPGLRKGFRAYHRRLQRLQSVTVIVAAAVIYALLVWLAIHVDRFAFLDTLARHNMRLAVHAVPAVVILAGLARILFRRVPLREIASRLEQADTAGTQERYSTLLDVSGRDPENFNPTERHLVDELRLATLALPNHGAAARLARAPCLRRWLLAGLLPAMLFALPALVRDYRLGIMLDRFYHPHREIARPAFVRLEVIAEKTAVGRGEMFMLQARRQGDIPRFWRWFMRVIGHPFNPTPVIAMDAGAAAADTGAPTNLSLLDEGLYFHTIADVQQNFRFRVSADDFTGDWLPVTVYELPAVTDLSVEITPPAYAGLPKQSLQPRPGQELYCLKGSLVRIVFRTNQPVETRQIISSVIAQPINPFWEEERNAGYYRFVFRDKDTLRIRLVNRDGNENSEPPTLRFEMLIDKPPAVDVDSSAIPVTLAATDTFEVPLKVRDDYGVRQLSVGYLRNPVPDKDEKFEELAIDLGAGKDGKTLDLRPVFDLKRINAMPGDVLQIRVVARDALGQIGNSHDLFLNVRAFGREIDEERSIRNLRHLVQALVTAVESSHAAGKGPVPLGITLPVYERLRRNLGEQGIAVAEAPNLESLFTAIAEEHYYTNHPRDRENMRLFCTALATVPLVAAWSGEPVFQRNEDTTVLCERVFLPILDERDLRNLLWRITGVQKAIARQQAPGAPAGATQLAGVLDDTLLDVNTRIGGIAARTGWVSSKLAGEIALEIRNAMTSSTARAKAVAPVLYSGETGEPFADYDPAAAAPVPAADGKAPAPGAPDLAAVQAALTKLRGECHAALGRSTGAWLAAEEKLRAFHDGLLRRCLEQLAAAEPDSVRLRDVFLPLLQDDARMLGLDPYAPLAAVVDNCRISAEALRAVYEPETRTPEPFRSCDSPAMRQDAANNARLHARTALLELAADSTATAAEKELGHELVLRGLARLTNAAGGAAVVQVPDAVPDFPGTATEHEAALTVEIEKLLPPLDLAATAKELQAYFDDTNGSKRDKHGRREPIGIDERKSFLVREKLYLSAVLYRLRLQLLLKASAGAEDALGQARIFFALRDFHNRPPVNPMMLGGRGQLMPEDYDNQLYVNEIPEHREAVLVRLASIFAEGEDPHYDRDDQYLQELGKSYTRLHGHGAMYLELLAADGPRLPDSISRHISALEDLGKAHARQLMQRVDGLLAETDRVRRQPQIRPETLLKGIPVLQAEIQSLGEGQYRESLLVAGAKFAEHTDILAGAETTISTAHYHLEALATGLQELRQMLNYYQMTVNSLHYLGGLPPGSSTDMTFRHHESARTSKARAALHQRQSLGCVLDARRDGMVPLRQGSFHAAHGHRLILSERTTFRYQKPVTGAVAVDRYDQFMNSIWYKNNNNPIRFYGDFWREYTQSRQESRHGWSVPREYRK